jgi:DamX protein
MSLPPDCLAQLKLRQPPFDAVPSEEFLYSDPLLESLVETAARALGAPGAIVILAGTAGGGRSIQLMRLLGTLAEDNYELIAFRGRSNITFDAVDVTIRNHLHVGGAGDATRSLADLLGDRSQRGDPLVLAVDDAHLLGMDIVRQLLRLRSEILEARGQGLRLILVGDQALSRGRLPLTDPADENQIVRLNLRPFNHEQAGAYLRHRLRVAGVDDPGAFLSSGDIAVLQTSSKGIPALLNANANAWLTRRCRSANGFKQTVTGKIGNLVTPSGSSLGRASSALGGPRRSPQPPAPAPAVEPPEGILELDVEDDRVDVRGGDHQLAEYLVQEDARPDAYHLEQVLRHVRNNSLSGDSAASAGSPKPEPPAPTKPPVASVPYWSRRWFMPVLVVVVLLAILIPVIVQLPERPQWLGSATQAPGSAEIGGAGADPSGRTTQLVGTSGLVAGPAATVDAVAPSAEPAKMGDGAVGQPVAPDQSASTSTSVPTAGQPPVSGPVTASQPVVPPPSESKPAPAATELSGTGDPQVDRAWLSQQDPRGYTIQLMAARDLPSAMGFIARHQLTGVRVIQTRARTVVLSGVYEERAGAERALPSLPEAVRSNKPWIRTIGSVLGSKR